jgi:hypothetical protein
VLGHLQQVVGRVEAAVDPVRAAGQGQVAVAVHQAGHDRGAGGVDRLRARAGIGLVAGGPDPGDAVVLDQDADSEAEARAGPVGERGVAVQGAGHVTDATGSVGLTGSRYRR